MSTAYQTGHRLPFPALLVSLHGETERTDPVMALLDTGADVTLVPVRLLERIGASEGALVTLRTHFGHAQQAQQYLISLDVDGHRLPGLYVVADDHGDDVILGRDVLNKLALCLDGPQFQTDILDDTTLQRLRARR